MNICPYCKHEAAIDEDLGVCKFCGAPRTNGDELDEKEVEEVFGNEDIVEEINIEQRKSFYENDLKAAKRKAADFYDLYQKPMRGKVFKSEQKYLKYILVGAIMLILLISFMYPGRGSVVERPPVFVQFNFRDSFTGGLLSGYEVSVYNSQTFKLIEVGLLSNGEYQTSNKYLDGQKIVVHLNGHGAICDFIDEIQISLNAQEIKEGIDKIALTTMKISNSFRFNFVSLYWINVNGSSLDGDEDFDFNLVVQNTEDKTGYMESFNFAEMYKERAYMYIKFDTMVQALSGDCGWFYMEATSSYLIFDVKANDLIKDSIHGLSGSATITQKVLFLQLGNITIHYGLVLNGNPDRFISMFNWGSNAMIFEEEAMIEVI